MFLLHIMANINIGHCLEFQFIFVVATENPRCNDGMKIQH